MKRRIFVLNIAILAYSTLLPVLLKAESVFINNGSIISETDHEITIKSNDGKKLLLEEKTF